MKAWILALLTLISLATRAADRPPQFVMLAFDNCQENQSWKQVSQFLDQMDSIQQDSVRFTFFLSGVGLLTDNAKKYYVDPLGRAGKSNINFGGDDMTVIERVKWINKLYTGGNEIASHAVGHFSGAGWSVDQWRHEFDQYEDIFNNFPAMNGFTGDKAAQAKLVFSIDKLVGFRAPYLEGGAKLNQVLMEHGYTYDTSNTDQGWEPSTWPKKFGGTVGSRGLWNFGLSFMTMPLTNITEEQRRWGASRTRSSVKLPAMDYNFCFKQTGGCDGDPYASQAENDALEMLQGYLKQFTANYNGNRAPIHIGHHFEQYRGGSYNRSLMRFAKAVCTLPEVRCTTYSQLADYLERAGSGARSEFQAGSFKKGTPVSFDDLWKRAFAP